MTRRHFFQLIGWAAMIPVLPRLARSAPMLWGDGINCDSDGLQAMMDSLPVDFADPSIASRIAWRGDVLDMGMVKSLLTKPVHIGAAFEGKTLTRAWLLLRDGVSFQCDNIGAAMLSRLLVTSDILGLQKATAVWSETGAPGLVWGAWGMGAYGQNLCLTGESLAWDRNDK